MNKESNWSLDVCLPSSATADKYLAGRQKQEINVFTWAISAKQEKLYFPIPHSYTPFPIPQSLLPTHYSLLPILYFLFAFPLIKFLGSIFVAISINITQYSYVSTSNAI